MNTDAIIQLLKKAEEHTSNHPLKAIEYAQEALKISKQVDYLEGKVRAITIIIAEHYFAGKSLEGLDFIQNNQRLIQSLQAPTVSYAKLIKAISTLYFGSNQLKTSLKYINKAKKIFEQHQLFYDVAASLMIIGNIYRYQAEYANAFVALKESLALYKKHELPKKIARIAHTNLGSLFLHIDEIVQATAHYKKALEYCEETDIKDFVFCYVNLGLVHLTEKEYEKAVVLLKKSILLNNNAYQYALSTSYYSLSGAFLGLNQIDEAQLWAEKAFEIATKTAVNSASYVLSLSYLLKCYNKKKQYAESLKLGTTFLEAYYVDPKFKDKTGLIREIGEVIEQIMTACEGLGDFEQAYFMSKELLSIKRRSFCSINEFKTLSIMSQYSIKEKEIELSFQKKLLEQQETLNKELQKNNKELDDFVNIAAHDLKAPIRNIHTFAKIILHNDTTCQETKDDINFILKSTQRMTSLIKSLLNYAKTGRANEELQNIDLNEVLIAVKNNLYSQIEESQANIVMQKLPIIKANFNFMIQLFQNILGNSIKYMKKDVAPEIHIITINKPHTDIIVLTDNGIGIKDEHLIAIFNPFKRLHTKNEYEGSGIGLATCKRIVENYNGKIWATSSIGKGTNFYLEFPHHHTVDQLSNLSIFSTKKHKH